MRYATKKLFVSLSLTALVGWQAAAETNEVTRIVVTGNRVSLRSGPDLNAELLDRAMKGDELEYLEQTNGWMAVVAPDTIDFWVAAEYVSDEGKVLPPKLNVRSGPNKNYSVVHVVEEGELLVSRGVFNGWVKVAPPAGSRVWVSADFAELIEPPAPVPEPAPEPVAVASVSEPAVPPPAAAAVPEPQQEELKPLVLVLDKSRTQGEYDEIPGVLRRANPGLYQLVLIVGDMEEPVCLVRGKEGQMERYLNRAMLIKGRKYWAVNVDLPIIQPDRIHLDPILND